MKIVIVGASFAGVSCAVEAKQRYPKDEVILIEKQPDVGYIPSGLSLVLKGAISSLDEAHFIDTKELETLGIKVLLNTCVREFYLNDYTLVTGQGDIIFDKLVLATGSSQVPKNLDMLDQTGLTFKNKADSLIALDKIKDSQNVIVIGAGQAGLELSDALIQAGKSVQIIETMDYPLYKYFDQDFLAPFIQVLNQEHQLSICYEETIKTLGEDTLVASNTQTHKRSTSPVLLAASVRPDLSLFSGQLELNTDQTISVDKFLRTSHPDVFAVGDLIQVPSSILPIATYVPLINTAIQTGKICAKNLKQATKAMPSVCQGVVTKLFGYYLGSCGLLEAESFMYPGKIGKVLLEERVSYTSSETIRMKILFDETTLLVLGVQLLSREPVVDKINQYTLMIDKKMTLEDLEDQERVYHPSLTRVNPTSYTKVKRTSK